MRRILAALLLLTPPLLAWSADKPRLNTLTPTEAADGWLLLFDGDSTFGWRAPNGSQWTVYDGLLAPQAGKPGLLVTTSPFRNYELHLEYQARPNSKAQLLLGCDADGKPVAATTVDLRHFSVGGWTKARITLRNGVVQSAQFEQRTVGGSAAAATSSASSNSRSRTGHIALSGNGVVFRNIKLRPLGAQPLFDGSDLAGWKVFEGRGKKSTFTVTPPGWLNVKNGPGDLQTEGQWADFVLQLQCISNGKHLNSGIFFRAIPGQYQNGYEAQIRNQFTAQPTQEYTVEDYDPQTHKLLGKRKVKSTAVDYGTGAIYRRVPARKAVAKDGAWFTLTVLAHGRHFATWVDGVPEADWTDNRPLKDNPRQGCRLEKGAISIQGHDPTTDLSFRAIRLIDLSPKEATPGSRPTPRPR